MQRHACRRRDACKDTRRDGERRIPEYGHVLQRRAIGKGAVPDRGHTLWDRDAGQLLASIKDVPSDRLEPLGQRDAGQHFAGIKGALFDGGELSVSGQRDARQRRAPLKGALADRGYVLRDRDAGQRRAIGKGILLDRGYAGGNGKGCAWLFAGIAEQRRFPLVIEHTLRGFKMGVAGLHLDLG